MTPNLKPADPLSQVVFIHDYIQLVFQEESFSLFNAAEILHQGASLRQGQAGFCDALVSLIDQHVTTVSTAPPYKLALTFEGGSCLRLLADQEIVCGAEAFEFHGRNNLWVIEQNT